MPPNSFRFYMFSHISRKFLTTMLVFLFLLISCSTRQIAMNTTNDPYLWLEEIESPKALEFAKTESEKTLNVFKSDKNFKEIEGHIRKLTYAKDRIAWGYPDAKGVYYNFWTDEKNPRGLWRKTTLSEYKKKNPKWEVILDLDQLAKKENENWVWHGANFLQPENVNCLISLSIGGKDANVVREFNVETKSFVQDGFYFPEAKSRVSWIDHDSLYVATDTGPDSLTDSGYPRTIKYVKRGIAVKDAPVIFEVAKTDLSTDAYVQLTSEGLFHFISRNISFYQNENWYFQNGIKTLIPMPISSNFHGYFKGYLLSELRQDLKVKDKTFKSGSLVALPLKDINDKSLSNLELVYGPSEKSFFQSLSFTKNFILLNVIDNISGKIFKVTFNGPHHWDLQTIPLGKNGVADVYDSNNENDEFIVAYSDFTTPYSTYMGDANDVSKLLKIKTSPERFDASQITSEQKFATSSDGTQIPYYIIHKKNMPLDGSNPTLLYGYGGFEVSMQPSYLSGMGKVWFEKGGVYVLANIRGGGEFGPKWHSVALKENRQIVFDDFIAIAEDLIKNKVTTPKHLGIMGGSNGGLLTAGTFIQRPELFNAVISEVPLIDMFRYHKLLAGASWMDEYGNPDDPKMHEVIAKYSPYQNVKADAHYPEVFFYTSTKDDRVHPGHARKIVAKMKDQGHPLFYYENTEGGHGGAANMEQRILKSAMEYTYLWRKLK